MFRLGLSFKDPGPSSPQGGQRGFPYPGQGAQTTGEPSHAPRQPVPWRPEMPTKGVRSWSTPGNPIGQAQRGFPGPGAPGQQREGWGGGPPAFGGVYQNWTPYYSRGAAAYVPNFGYTLVNPIGAGVVALHRPQASYGPAAIYANGQIWWVSQDIPTSIRLQGLTSPEVLAAQLSDIEVQAVMRTTG